MPGMDSPETIALLKRIAAALDLLVRHVQVEAGPYADAQAQGASSPDTSLPASKRAPEAGG